MRLKSIFATVGIVILLLTACSPKPEITGSEYYFEYDHNVSMMTDFSAKMAEGEEGFYYLSLDSPDSFYLRYIDKDTMEDIILCGKPNCTHTDDSCNAWAYMGTVDGLFLYEEKLYYVTRVRKKEEAVPVLVLMQKPWTAVPKRKYGN